MKVSTTFLMLTLAAQTRANQLRRVRNDGVPVITSSYTESHSAEDFRQEDFFQGERELAEAMSMSMSMSMPTKPPTNPPTRAPTPPPTAPLLCPPLSNEERVEAIVDLLTQVSDPADLRNPNTPQFKAADWLLTRDTYNVCPNDPDCPNKVANRYIAALLYYSTGGEDWTNCGAAEDGSDCITTGIPPAVPPCIGGGNRWLSGADECTWCGNSCANEEAWDPPVTAPACFTTDIQLESIDQSGELPAEIGFLSEMRTIRMENGDIAGSLPEEWSSLLKLRRLDLNFQLLGGTIPESYFTGMTQLVQLDLNDNSLSGTLSDSIGLMTELDFIQLGGNEFSGDFPLSLGSLQFLRLLEVQDNGFVGELPAVFVSDVLEEVNFRNNELSGGIDFLGNLANIESLTKVDARSNMFTGTIPTALEDALNLNYFDVSFNLLSGVMPPGMEVLDIDPLSSDCGTPQRVVCPFCTQCTSNP